MPRYSKHLDVNTFIEREVRKDGKLIGTIRVKASGISWRPKGKHKYLSVSFEQFENWIVDPKTKSRKESRW